MLRCASGYRNVPSVARCQSALKIAP
jgi:hypothetical protein